MKILAIAIVVLAAHCTSGGIPNRADVKVKEWWETASMYQIYPRSFMDSDNDGIGDLRGIKSKLQHLKESGIDATWLSPIFKSPMADMGYDISNFYEIQEDYGTMEDFEELIAEAKKLDIKIILDFVPNHSSDENEWFIKSLASDTKYKDYYVWKDPVKDINGNNDLDDDGNPKPPNNWVSVFGGPAWTYRVERDQFYLHQFDKKQPDLNYQNPVVRAEMENVLTYWLNKGVYGFRVDAIPHLCEDQRFLDEPVTGTETDPNNYGYTEKIYTKDQDFLYDVVSDWRNLVDAFTENTEDKIPRILMMEAYTSVENTMKYFGGNGRSGAQIPFNFFLINDVKTTSDATVLKSAIHTWMDNMPAGKTANWVIGNHDQGRVATRAGPPARADGFNMMVRLLPGLGVTYQGEEIAMEDVYVSWERTTDPQACNGGKQGFEARNRDRARTPFQWDSSNNAGFSKAAEDKLWLPVDPNYKVGNRNLQAQKNADVSHYKVFLKLSELRATKTAQDGKLDVQVLADEVIAFTRKLDNEDTIAFVFNLGSIGYCVDVTSKLDVPKNMKVHVSDVNSHRKENDVVAMDSVDLKGYEAIVFYGNSAAVIQFSFLLMCITVLALINNIS